MAHANQKSNPDTMYDIRCRSIVTLEASPGSNK